MARKTLWQAFLKDTAYSKITMYDNHKNISRNELKPCDMTQYFQIGACVLSLRQKYINCFFNQDLLNINVNF